MQERYVMQARIDRPAQRKSHLNSEELQMALGW